MTDKRFLERVLTARVYDVAKETPLDAMPALSARLENQVWIKREDLQSVFSFKLRGAYNKIFKTLKERPDLPGVIAASAGNHAQGVALAASRLKLPAIIVMPETTPEIKVSAVRARGAKAVLHGANYDEAFAYSQELVKEKGYAFIHPFDDLDVMAGQGTIAQEILRQHPEQIDYLFVPVGGGGLLAGILGFLKAIRPEIKIIGVEPEDAPSLYKSMQQGRRVKLSEVGIFADGVAVKQIGQHTFKMIRDLVDGVVLVSTDQICAAIKDLYEDTRAISEPAGATALAGLKKYAAEHQLKGCTLLTINSGANMNFDRLRHVSERAELGEQREALLAVKIPEKPGSFKRFCRTIGKRQITEFNYRFADERDAVVFAGVQLREGVEERQTLIEQLRIKGYEVVDMTDNEVAKLHTRYMVGGHAGPQVSDERLYRVEFPERPGALLSFLSQIGTRWNISLFHYRNHGSDYGRVLMGIQVPSADIKAFKALLAGLDFSFVEETRNPVYQLFLQ